MTFRIIILFCSSFCCGQTYKPLLDNTNQWHFTTCNSGCLTDIYYTDGDTLVNGLNHKVLDGFHYQSRTFLLREEISTKKVYLKKINPTSISEYLLYDFSLNEGDTFNMENPLSPFPLHGGTFILDSIRMKPLVNAINYKHFYFSPTAGNSVSSNNVVWIEGIGSKSLINAPAGHANINEVGHLSCFFKNQELVYSNLDSISGCSFLTLNVRENNFNINDLKLIQTEIKNKFILVNKQLIFTYEIKDVLGKTIKKETPEKSDNIEIDATGYSSNIYFIFIYDNQNRRKVFKLIVN